MAFVRVCFLCLTNDAGYIILRMKTYSTLQVAKLLGLTSATLHRWIRQKKIQAPPVQSLGGVQVRLWTLDDLEKARKYKADHYWGKGGRAQRKKTSK
jgi:excisionase family DNA binding protein